MFFIRFQLASITNSTARTRLASPPNCNATAGWIAASDGTKRINLATWANVISRVNSTAILLTAVKHFSQCSPFLARISANSYLLVTIIFLLLWNVVYARASRRSPRYREEGERERVAGKVERNFVLYMSTRNGQLQRSRATLRNRSEGTAKWVFNKISSFVIVPLQTPHSKAPPLCYQRAGLL